MKRLLLLFALPLLAACGKVRSVEPAIGAAESIEVPALAGRWVDARGRAALEIVPGPTRTPSYRVRRTTVEDGDTTRAWLDARAGRIGGRLVLELRPSSIMERYRDSDGWLELLTPRYTLRVIELSGDTLRMARLHGDSVRSRLMRGACTSAATADSANVLLRGASAEVRATYACLLDGRRTVVPLATLRRAS